MYWYKCNARDIPATLRQTILYRSCACCSQAYLPSHWLECSQQISPSPACLSPLRTCISIVRATSQPSFLYSTSLIKPIASLLMMMYLLPVCFLLLKHLKCISVMKSAIDVEYIIISIYDWVMPSITWIPSGHHPFIITFSSLILFSSYHLTHNSFPQEWRVFNIKLFVVTHSLLAWQHTTY
jgi:hypothetical protein